MDDQRESIISPLIWVLFAYMLKYLVYGFLTVAVLSTFSATMIIYTTVWGSNLQFLQYLSFILPINAEGNAHLDGNDIMRVFSLLTLIIMILSEVARAIIGRLRPSSNNSNKRLVQRIWNLYVREMMASSIVITMIFLITALVLPFAELTWDTSLIGIYGVVGIFYLIAIISNAIFTAVNNIAEYILVKVKTEIKTKRI